MISSEKVFDMIPTFVGIYRKLEINEYKNKLSKDLKNKKNVNKDTMGGELLLYVLENSPKIKEEIYEIVSIFEDKTVEETKAEDVLITFNTFKNLLTDKDTMDFFTSAMK